MNIEKNPIELMETQELIQKLIKNGYENLVEAFIENESEVYTKGGRLNKSGACRILQWKPKQLEDMLERCKEVLIRDV